MIASSDFQILTSTDDVADKLQLTEEEEKFRIQQKLIQIYISIVSQEVTRHYGIDSPNWVINSSSIHNGSAY